MNKYVRNSLIVLTLMENDNNEKLKRFYDRMKTKSNPVPSENKKSESVTSSKKQSITKLKNQSWVPIRQDIKTSSKRIASNSMDYAKNKINKKIEPIKSHIESNKLKYGAGAAAAGLGAAYLAGKISSASGGD